MSKFVLTTDPSGSTITTQCSLLNDLRGSAKNPNLQLPFVARLHVGKMFHHDRALWTVESFQEDMVECSTRHHPNRLIPITIAKRAYEAMRAED